MRKLKNEELQRMDAMAFKQTPKVPLILVLDNIRSLHNVGSVFRTADAFRLEMVYLCGITAQPPHREIQKTALGATESVDWEYSENTYEALTKLKRDNYIIIGIEQTDESLPLDTFIPEVDKKYALVFGHEVYGIDETMLPLLDLCVEVPQYGTKHSLNIAVCVGIVLWDLFGKINAEL